MDWIRGHNLGQGSTATVYMAEDLCSGEVFAVKSAELNRSEVLKREQRILSKINCPQIVGYKGCDVTFENGVQWFNLFMEYAPHGTLADVIKNHGGGMEEALVGSYARQILLGLNYLHSNGIVHCDVKGQNVLVSEQGAKIADMGCARRVEEDELVIAGTPAFMAPEVARGEQQGFPADIWALGCTVLEMITGKPVWRGVSDPAVVLYGVGFSGELPEIPSSVSEQGRDFLNKCLKRDPNERWSVSELLGHCFVVGEFKELVLDSDTTPTSVLERGFWDSLETSQSKGPTFHSCCSSDSTNARDRIRSVCGDKLPVWDDDDDDQWIMVRSNEEELDALSFEEIQDFESDTVCVVSNWEDSLVIFYEPKIVLVDKTVVELSSRCKLCNAIVDYCCRRSYNCSCRIKKLLLVYQCRKIVPRVKLDTHNKEIFIMPCFLHSLCLFNFPLDELNALRFKIELIRDSQR